MTYLVELITDVDTTTVQLGTVAPGTKLTVSDPCYLDDDYTGPLVYGVPNHAAAINGVELYPGEWYAYADMADMGPGGLGGMRVIRSGIAIRGTTTEQEIAMLRARVAGNSTQEVQGVDAGMVGYFIGEPELAYEDTWKPYVTGNGGIQDTRLLERPSGKVWITSSGFGDGAYGVWIAWLDGKIVSVETTFIAQADPDDDALNFSDEEEED